MKPASLLIFAGMQPTSIDTGSIPGDIGRGCSVYHIPKGLRIPTLPDSGAIQSNAGMAVGCDNTVIDSIARIKGYPYPSFRAVR